MRIACVHIPQFALQCVTRLDPSLRRAPVVVVGSGLDPGAGTVTRVALHSPIVHACSRAAWAHGVRIGMTATAARSLSPELVIVSADSTVEREAVRAIADVLLGSATTIDIGGRVGPGGAHLAMYTDVPVKTRGQSFGDKLIELLDELGLAARIGIADDRFTAWVAASSSIERQPAKSDDGWESSVVSVPRGGSAAFLAPRPLSLLAISPEVQHMLEALGVRSLGEFAALPAPSVARPQVAAAGADFQALARGESGALLRPYLPEASIREDVLTSDSLGGVTALAMLGNRLALRLAGRGRVAARLEITTTTAGGSPRTIGETLDDTTGDATELAEIIGLAIGELERGTRVRVVVAGEAIPGAVATPLHARGSDATERADVPAVLSVILSSTGSSATWSLTTPEPTLHTERREAHRRMRRGKQRRHTIPAQSRLWKVE